MAYASQSQLRQAELRYAKTRSSADISWSVGVKQHQSSDDVALSAGFSMPLFSGDRNQGAVDAAIAAKAEVSLNRDIALLALRNELYRAYSSRKLAIAQVKQLQQQIIPTLTAAMADSELAYEQGNYSYLAYLSASEELLLPSAPCLMLLLRRYVLAWISSSLSPNLSPSRSMRLLNFSKGLHNEH